MIGRIFKLSATPSIRCSVVQQPSSSHGKRTFFDINIEYSGTSFQIECWKHLLDIEYGTTCSYSDLAYKLKKPKAYRAIGQAIHQNPIEIIIPCHRVVGKNGQLVGYASGIKIKQRLLEIEGSVCL